MQKTTWSELNSKCTVPRWFAVSAQSASVVLGFEIYTLLVMSKGANPKITQHKLRSDVNWQRVLKQKAIKEMGIK
jgi:hypothetical protein